jgi:hypothetical protein
VRHSDAAFIETVFIETMFIETMFIETMSIDAVFEPFHGEQWRGARG